MSYNTEIEGLTRIATAISSATRAFDELPKALTKCATALSDIAGALRALAIANAARQTTNLSP